MPIISGFTHAHNHLGVKGALDLLQRLFYCPGFTVEVKLEGFPQTNQTVI